MSEYIEREVALHGMDANIFHLRKVADENPLLNKAVNLVQYTRDFIAALPAADVVERKRGEWAEHYDADRELWYFDCPFCGDDYSAVTKYLQNFCPNCGADMRGRTNVSN